MLRSLSNEDSCNAIKRIPLGLRPSEDKLVLTKSRNGEFSVRSAYWTSLSYGIGTAEKALWSKIWKLKALEHMKMNLWRIASGVLPTIVRMANPSYIYFRNVP